jgi:hypothetical protein
MIHYQLRFPDAHTAHELAAALAERGARALEGEPGLTGPAGAIAARLLPILAAHLQERVYAFDTCGLYRSCLDSATPSAWNADPAPVPGSWRTLTLAHLKAPDGLDAFARGATEAMAAAAGLDPAELAARPALAGRLAGAVRETVGPFLYESEICENEQILRAAEPAPTPVSG